MVGVRDLLRGQVPKDFDIATDARSEVVQKLFPQSARISAFIVVLENEFQFEVATFRSDGVYLDGRRPLEVHFATAETSWRLACNKILTRFLFFP